MTQGRAMMGRYRSASEVLTWARAATEPGLRAAVHVLPAPLREAAEYHFGWNEDATTASGAGKAMRPAFTLVAADAVGGRAASALPVAVAVELVHNYSLIHDDVMDGDVMRRHRPTVWRVFGVNAAILTGDALLSLALGRLADSTNPAARQAVRSVCGSVQHLLAGQFHDLAFERRQHVRIDEYEEMARGKTGALLAASCALGGAFGGATEAQVERLTSFGAAIGLAFQVTDDILGIWGDPARTGKPRFSDLRGRKRSLPVLAATTASDSVAKVIADLYGRSAELDETELTAVAELIEQTGAREWCQGRADELLHEARTQLAAADLAAQGEAELLDLARMATRRDH